jgi:hypothetical protein
MTQTEKEALVLFRDYTHLQLKMFQANVDLGSPIGDHEQELLNTALDMHAIYRKEKLASSDEA